MARFNAPTGELQLRLTQINLVDKTYGLYPTIKLPVSLLQHLGIAPGEAPLYHRYDAGVTIVTVQTRPNTTPYSVSRSRQTALPLESAADIGNAHGSYPGIILFGSELGDRGLIAPFSTFCQRVGEAALGLDQTMLPKLVGALAVGSMLERRLDDASVVGRGVEIPDLPRLMLAAFPEFTE